MSDQPRTSESHDAIGPLRDHWRKAGGWRLLLRFALLWIYAASLFLLVAAPYELYMVHAVRAWAPVAAHVKSVSLLAPPFQDGPPFWQFTFTRDDTGAELITSDLRPGDLPFNLFGWSTMDAEAARYHPGMAVQVFIAPGGRKFFPEQGSPGLMLSLFAACAALWLWVAARIIQRRR